MSNKLYHKNIESFKDVNDASINIFGDFESDFYHYMILRGNLAPKTSKDYISRLRFLSQYYPLDEHISKEYIDYIIETENVKRLNRHIYTSIKAMSDFRSGLNKFLGFIQSNYYKELNELELNEMRKVESNEKLTTTERISIIQSRLGQGTFRSSLIRYWQGCSISNCALAPILIASHIKPWCASDNQQRLDVYNGLLLLPNYDKLFDKGYISFDAKGNLITSHLLSKETKVLLGLDEGLSLRKLETKHIEYLKYHNENCFMR